MIKIRRVPACGRVAIRAIRNSKCRTRGRVDRIVGLLPSGKMAAGVAAIRRSDLQIVVIVDVAGRARHIGVARSERKTYGTMVEFRRQPTVCGVACFAGGREAGSSVVGICCGLQIVLVAGNAERRKSLILPNGRALVALLAWHCGVRTKKWEPVLMILQLLRRDFPTQHRVATGAVCPHLPLVDVRMAVLTMFANVREHRVCVARDTVHFFVHPAKRIFCFGMVEFRNFADRPPSRGGVAVFARNIQCCAMRTLRSLSLRLTGRSGSGMRNVSKRKAKPA